MSRDVFSGWSIARLKPWPDREAQWFVLLYDRGRVIEAHPYPDYASAVGYFERKKAA